MGREVLLVGLTRVGKPARRWRRGEGALRLHPKRSARSHAARRSGDLERSICRASSG